MEAQCWICPYCFDDHKRDGDCVQKDLRERIDKLEERVRSDKDFLDTCSMIVKTKELESTNAELTRKLAKAVEQRNGLIEMSSPNNQHAKKVKTIFDAELEALK